MVSLQAPEIRTKVTAGPAHSVSGISKDIRHIIPMFIDEAKIRVKAGDGGNG
jgi:hypothetical protein